MASSQMHAPPVYNNPQSMRNVQNPGHGQTVCCRTCDQMHKHAAVSWCLCSTRINTCATAAPDAQHNISPSSNASAAAPTMYKGANAQYQHLEVAAASSQACRTPAQPCETLASIPLVYMHTPLQLYLEPACNNL
jgi:hypothetical protein